MDSIKIEELDLNNDHDGITLDIADVDTTTPNRSVNFGGGVELLMNDKKDGGNKETSIEVDDLDKLENELNELTDNTPSGSSREMKSKLFDIDNGSVNINLDDSIEPIVGGSKKIRTIY